MPHAACSAMISNLLNATTWRPPTQPKSALHIPLGIFKSHHNAHQPSTASAAHHRPTQVKATSDTLVCFTLHRKTFQRLFGSMTHLINLQLVRQVRA